MFLKKPKSSLVFTFNKRFELKSVDILLVKTRELACLIGLCLLELFNLKLIILNLIKDLDFITLNLKLTKTINESIYSQDA